MALDTWESTYVLNTCWCRHEESYVPWVIMAVPVAVANCVMKAGWKNLLCAHLDYVSPVWDHFNAFEELLGRIHKVDDIQQKSILLNMMEDIISMRDYTDALKSTIYTKLLSDRPSSYILDLSEYREIWLYFTEIEIIYWKYSSWTHLTECLNEWEEGRVNFLILKIQKVLKELFTQIISQVVSNEPNQ